VTLIEADKEKSLKIAGQLKKTMVVQADGTEMDTLQGKGYSIWMRFVAG
jgi:Trk K+ transport system NAD-binding subunit